MMKTSKKYRDISLYKEESKKINSKITYLEDLFSIIINGSNVVVYFNYDVIWSIDITQLENMSLFSALDIALMQLKKLLGAKYVGNCK